jgi:hypothetical protein
MTKKLFETLPSAVGYTGQVSPLPFFEIWIPLQLVSAYFAVDLPIVGFLLIKVFFDQRGL